MALGFTQPLIEMSTSNISLGGGVKDHLHVPIVLKFGSLNPLETSGPLACNGITVPVPLQYF
jgi:hypothetical protein